MANAPILTISGNITADPDFRYTTSNVARVNFTVANTPRAMNRDNNQWEDKEAIFMDCTAWRSLAENIHSSLKKGNRVLVTGTLESHSWKAPDGTNRRKTTMRVDDIGPSLLNASMQITRNQAASQGGGFTQNNTGQNYNAPQGFTAPAAQAPAVDSNPFDPPAEATVRVTTPSANDENPWMSAPDAPPAAPQVNAAPSAQAAPVPETEPIQTFNEDNGNPF